MSKPNRIVSHYTSANGFKGIIESQAIWASDLRYLNDTKELRFGLKSMIDTLWETLGFDLSEKEEIKLRQGNPAFFEFIDSGTPPAPETPSPLRMVARYAANSVSHEFGLVDRPDVSDTFKSILGYARVGMYVASFSERHDDLSQWRGYGDHGGGLSLGFSVDVLRDSLSYKGWVRDPSDSSNDNLQPGPNAPIGPVAYGKNQRRTATRLIAEQMIQNAGVETVPWVLGTMYCTANILRVACSCKNKKFASESEWRAAVVDYVVEKDVKFRPSPTFGFIPYIDLHFPREALKEVIVGPGSNSALRIELVQHMLESAGFSDVNVLKSAVPFRS